MSQCKEARESDPTLSVLGAKLQTLNLAATVLVKKTCLLFIGDLLAGLSII